MTIAPSGYFSIRSQSGLFKESFNFEYSIQHKDCPAVKDSAKVVISIEKPTGKIPNGITPNGDGLNDFFIIPEIEQYPTKYFESELVIFNRWGDIVFQSGPYHNDWGGLNNSGEPLPEGTYYYKLTLDLKKGEFLQGDITIIR